MQVYLLDINVLIARLDSAHEHHELATQWWHRQAVGGWATCPLTENGFIRILGHPNYPGWPGDPERAATALRGLITAIPGHRFFADEISLLNRNLLPSHQKAGPRDITDLYLLALAVHHNALFVTLDTKTKSQLISGGSNSCIVIR